MKLTKQNRRGNVAGDDLNVIDLISLEIGFISALKEWLNIISFRSN